jgi:glycosyltransferase involved in cell wall biosynthesis
MNICIFARSTIYHWTGGMEIHLEHIIKGLSSRGHNISVITTTLPDKRDSEELSRNKVDYYFVKAETSGKYSKLWWNNSLHKFENLQNEGKRFHIVLSQSGGACTIIKKIIKKYNLSVVCMMHGTTYNQFMGSFRQIKSLRKLIQFIFVICPQLLMYYFLELHLYLYSQTIISVTVDVTKDIHKFYFIKESKINTIPNGVDLNLFYPSEDLRREVRARYMIREEEKVILFLSRIDKMKGVEIAIKALSIIVNDYKKMEIKLLIVGKGSEEYILELKQMVSDLNLSNNVLFIGHVSNDQTPAYYNACDMFIMPTLCNEGCPFVLLECMASGKPAIASEIGGISSIIDNGINGILVPLGDTNSLADMLMKILSNSMAEDMGQKAREKAEAFFSIDKMVAETEKVIKSCLSNNL